MNLWFEFPCLCLKVNSLSMQNRIFINEFFGVIFWTRALIYIIVIVSYPIFTLLLSSLRYFPQQPAL